MDPRVLFLVVIFVGFGTFIDVAITNPTAASKRISSDIAKLILDCKLTNSHNFTECLRRQKRQHHDMGTVYTNRVINISEALSGPITNVAEKNDTPVVVNNHIHVHNHYDDSSKRNTSSKITNYNPYDCLCFFIIWTPCACRPQHSIYQYPYQWPINPYGGFDLITPGLRPFIVVAPPIPIPAIPMPTIPIPPIPMPTIPTTTTIPPMSGTPTVSATPSVPTAPMTPATPTVSATPSVPTAPMTPATPPVSATPSVPTAPMTPPTISMETSSSTLPPPPSSSRRKIE